MRIDKLSLKNFRGFEELEIDFPDGEGGLAVFIGVNYLEKKLARL